MAYSVLNKFLDRKNHAIQHGDKLSACRAEAVFGLLSLEAGSVNDAMISLLSAASLAAELAGKPIEVRRKLHELPPPRSVPRPEGDNA